jgi:hypothetical protein
VGRSGQKWAEVGRSGQKWEEVRRSGPAIMSDTVPDFLGPPGEKQ